MPNLYSRLSAIKDEMGIAPTNTEHDTRLLRLDEQVSRGIDDHCARHFYALQNQTRYAVGDDRGLGWLPLGFDLAALTTVKTGLVSGGTYSYTLVADTDYLTLPFNRGTYEPITGLEVGPFATQLGSWPYGHNRAVQIVGTVGYSFELEDTGETASAIASTTATTVTSTGDDIDAGETIVIDTEQMYVAAESDNVLTVVRAINGSVAATHAGGAAIYRRRYPRAVELATTMEVVRTWREMSTGGSGQAGGNDLGYAFSATYPRIRDLLQPFNLRKFGIA